MPDIDPNCNGEAVPHLLHDDYITLGALDLDAATIRQLAPYAHHYTADGTPYMAADHLADMLGFLHLEARS